MFLFFNQKQFLWFLVRKILYLLTIVENSCHHVLKFYTAAKHKQKRLWASVKLVYKPLRKKAVPQCKKPKDKVQNFLQPFKRYS